MKNLIEIARLITKQKIRKIEIIDEQYLENTDRKFHQFYEGLTNNRFRNDRDAAKHLYNRTPGAAKYRQLKSRFRKRLLNTLFFIDFSKQAASNYERARATCNKDWTLVNILLSNHAEGPAYQIARQTLTLAKKFQITSIVVNCARILRQGAAKEGDLSAFEEYHECYTSYLELEQAETRSEEIYQRVQLNYLLQNQYGVPIDEYCNELSALDERYQSLAITYNTYLVWILRFEMEENYEGMLDVCEQADKFIEDNYEMLIEEKQIVLQTKKMLTYLHLKDYNNGRVSAEKCLNDYRTGSRIWFAFMEYYLLLALHTEQYIQAIAIFNEAYYNNNFKKLSHQQRDKWFIYEAYLNYLVVYLKEDQPILKQQQRKRFAIAPFLDKRLNYPKEERIFTVLIVILQALLYIEQKKYAQAKLLIDQLRNMANRQLKIERYHRPIQFIRLLKQLEKANFQPEDLTNTEKYIQEFERNPFAYRGILRDLEIIPYEKLWELLIARMRR